MAYKTTNTDLLKFLNRNYLVTSHLMERLDEVKESVSFEKAASAINSTVALLQIQIKKLDHLYNSIGETYSFAGYDYLVAMLEEVFAPVQEKIDSANLFLLDYMLLTDCLREQSCRMASLTIDRFYDIELPDNFIYDSAITLPLKGVLENVTKVR